jgi:hypothetical protein
MSHIDWGLVDTDIMNSPIEITNNEFHHILKINFKLILYVANNFIKIQYVYGPYMIFCSKV